MTKLKVNKDSCIGCGGCVGSYPEVFTFDENGKAECIKEVSNPDEVIAVCPAQAISK